MIPASTRPPGLVTALDHQQDGQEGSRIARRSGSLFALRPEPKEETSMPIATSQKRPFEETDLFAGKEGIRFAYSTDGRDSHVLECPPSRVKVCYVKSFPMMRDKRRHFTLRLPWTYFVEGVQTRCYFLYFSQKRVESVFSPITMAPLPNILQHGVICFGHYELSRDRNPALRMRTVLNLFWASPFSNSAWPGKKLLPEGWRYPDRLNLHFIFEDWVKFDRKKIPIRWKRLKPRYGTPVVSNLDGAMRYACNVWWGKKECFHAYCDRFCKAQ